MVSLIDVPAGCCLWLLLTHVIAACVARAASPGSALALLLFGQFTAKEQPAATASLPLPPPLLFATSFPSSSRQGLLPRLPDGESPGPADCGLSLIPT